MGRGPESNFFNPNLSQCLECGDTKHLHLNALQDGRRSAQKENQENTLNKCSKQDFVSMTLLVIVAPILKVVRNLLQTFHLYVDSLIWFRCRMIVSA